MTTLITVYNNHAREMGQNITSSELDTPSAHEPLFSLHERTRSGIRGRAAGICHDTAVRPDNHHDPRRRTWQCPP
jgi:hypothetical protein